MLPQLLVPELRQVLYSLDLKAAAGQKVHQAAAILRNFASAFKVKVGDIENRRRHALEDALTSTD